MLVMVASLILTACGEDSTSTSPKQVDLPKDRALVLSNRDGWPDLYTVDFTGKFTGRLTESAAAEYGAVWSPDGRRVAFTELNGDQAAGDYARNHQIVVIDADGTNRKVVAQDGFNPVWSPDSQKILFTKILANSPVGQTLPGARGVANIAAAPPDQTAPTPTSSSINRGIVPATANTSNLVGGQGAVSPGLPTAGPGDPQATPGLPVPNDEEPTPAPATGSTTGNTARAGLYVVPVDTGQPNLLVADGIAGAWSPDGKRLAYITGNNILDQKRSLYVANADGKEAVSLTERAKLLDLDVVYLAWSPDSTTLAFTATDTQRNKTSLYRLSPDATQARRLADYDGSAREVMSMIWAYADPYNPAARLHLGPVWSPNSRSLAFTDGSARLTVVDASNGSTRYFSVGSAALGQDSDSVLSVVWLPDNRRLLYDRASAGRNTLQAQAGNYIYDFFDETLETLDTANKNTLALYNGPGASFVPVCCGMDLLGAGSPAAPGATVAPTTAPSPTPSANATASNDGRLIYTSGVGQRQLIVQDLKSGTRTVISSGAFKLIDFNLAPKGDRIAYVEVGDHFNATLYVVGLDGKQKRKLTEGNGNPDDLSYLTSWSADGHQLAFQALSKDPNLKSGLYSVTVDGPDNVTSAPRLVTSKDVSAFAWSPDGKQIAYRVEDDTYKLFIGPVDGSSPAKEVASLGHFDFRYSSLGRGLAWSPDGRYLALSGAGGFSYNAIWQLWLVTPQGNIEQQPGYYINRIIGFTPDSSRLLVTMASSSQTSTIQVFLMPNGIGGSRSWRSYDRGSGPLSSPDSRYLAFYSRASENNLNSQFSAADQAQRLVVLGFSNGVTRPLTLDYTPYFAFKARFYAWQPDSKALAFYQNNTIYLLNAQGAQQKPEVLARAFAVDRLAWAK
jgi:Tol biopolymer transport system component